MSSVADEAAAVVAAAAAAAQTAAQAASSSVVSQQYDIAAPATIMAGEEYTKHFATVRKNPVDFNTWALLLNASASEKYEAIVQAFDAFLSYYPFCYGYWKKYADHTQRNASANGLGPEAVIAVYERGVAAVPHSVDMWAHYCNFMSCLLYTSPSPRDRG